MKLELINKENQSYAEEVLQHFYANEMIPAEKKTYLTHLEGSIGPYLGISSADGKTRYLMDAASQIATLGLGFNSSVLMGASQFLESWTNDQSTETYQNIRLSLEKFLKRKTGWPKVFTSFCNSGAEATEMSLGYCYRRRNNPKANKVLAFEGSFHGRMIVALNSTFNKAKREPFEFPGINTTFAPYPQLDDDNINQTIPEGWRELWDQAPRKKFEIPKEWHSDPILKREIDCLLKIRDYLRTGEYFAVLLEPMQCEGGDKFSSGRFHNALNLMAKSFNVPYISDEVQTGFNLGRNFFWHTQFEMKDVDGSPLFPDYVICAKKAQVGMVISPCDFGKDAIEAQEQFAVASSIRGYLHGMAIDQMQPKTLQIEKWVRDELNNFLSKYSEFTAMSRCCGLAFAFDLKNKDHVQTFVQKRFDYGLLFYPAGQMTLRFRMNNSFSKNDIKFLFEQLSKMANEIFLGEEADPIMEVETHGSSVEQTYKWQRLILKSKLMALRDESPNTDLILKEINSIIQSEQDYNLVIIDEDNYQDYKDKIQKLQVESYEPTRQTSEERFHEASKSKFGVCLGLNNGDDLIAISFASSLKDHPLERALRRDPNFENPAALYTLDTTVAKEFHGRGLGRQMKYALKLLAMTKGAKTISGRNRDRLAAAMLNINLSVGSYQLFHIEEDYPDFEEFRDVIYYTTELSWSEPNLSLSNRTLSPTGSCDLSSEFLNENLPGLANKMCLSNFVDKKFLETVEDLLADFPEDLRHGYSCSGQSECVDKLAKSIWYSVHKNPNNISFKGHFFGNGSFMSRSLSDTSGSHSFFPVTHLDHPTEENWKRVLKELKECFETEKYLGVWIEPIRQLDMSIVPREFLVELRKLTLENGVPLLYNETASSSFSYSDKHFYVSNDAEISPDGGFVFLGGQAGLVFMCKEVFVAKPLMMISTWDGDQLSFSLYQRAKQLILENHKDYLKDAKDFQNKLFSELKKFQVSDIQFKNGKGSFVGSIPRSLSSKFKKFGDRYIVNPNWCSMNRFMENN